MIPQTHLGWTVLLPRGGSGGSPPEDEDEDEDEDRDWEGGLPVYDPFLDDLEDEYYEEGEDWY